MVFFRPEKGPSWGNLSSHRTTIRGLQLPAQPASGHFLVGGMIENCRSILTTVRVAGVSGVVHLEEVVQKLQVAHSGRIKDDPDCLGMTSGAATDARVSRRLCCASRIADAGGDHPIYILKLALYTPEASAGESCRLQISAQLSDSPVRFARQALERSIFDYH